MYKKFKNNNNLDNNNLAILTKINTDNRLLLKFYSYK